LRISKNYFHQDLRQATFFHGVPLEDNRYDMNKGIVNGKFISVNRNEDDNMDNAEGQGDTIGGVQVEVEPSLEEVFEPL